MRQRQVHWEHFRRGNANPHPVCRATACEQAGSTIRYHASQVAFGKKATALVWADVYGHPLGGTPSHQPRRQAAAPALVIERAKRFRTVTSQPASTVSLAHALCRLCCRTGRGTVRHCAMLASQRHRLNLAKLIISNPTDPTHSCAFQRSSRATSYACHVNTRERPRFAFLTWGAGI